MRKLFTVLAASAIMLIGFSVPAASASTHVLTQPVGSSTIGNGVGQCLDAQGLSVGSAVDMVTCDPSNPDQQWDVTSRGSFRLWGHDKFVSNGALGIDLSYQAGELDFTYNNNHTLQDNASGDYLTWVPGSNPQPGLEAQDGQSDQTWYIFTYLGGPKTRTLAAGTQHSVRVNRCTEDYIWKVGQTIGIMVFHDWGEAEWTTGNCNFSMQTRVKCQVMGLQTYYAYSGHVTKLLKWDRATCGTDDTLNQLSIKFNNKGSWKQLYPN